MEIKPNRSSKVMSMKRLSDILTTEGFKTDGFGLSTTNEEVSGVRADYANSPKYPSVEVHVRGPPSLPLMQACFDKERTYVSDDVHKRMEKYELSEQDSCTYASVFTNLSGPISEENCILASNLYEVRIELGDGFIAKGIGTEIKSIDEATLVLSNVMAARDYITRQQTQAKDP